MSTWNQRIILKTLFERYSTYGYLDHDNLNQVLLDLSNPFPLPFEHSYKLKDKINFEEFDDFIRNCFFPKKKEWLSSFKSDFMHFKNGKIELSRLYHKIKHLISKLNFSLISPEQLKFEELLEILHLDDIIEYQSSLSTELAQSPIISYASSLLKKDIEFSSFELSESSMQYALEVKMLGLSHVSSYFCKNCNSKFKFVFQLLPGSLSDIISNIYTQNVKFRVYLKNSAIYYDSFIPLIELLFNRKLSKYKIQLQPCNKNSSEIQLSFIFKDFTQDQFKFVHIFDAFQISLRATQLGILKSSGSTYYKKLEVLFNAHPIKTFPLVWNCKGQHVPIEKLLRIHNMENFGFANQKFCFNPCMSNKSALDKSSLDIFTKLKACETQNLDFEIKNNDWNCQISLYIRSIEEILQEKRISRFESVLYAYGLPLNIQGEIVMGWKNGYPTAILLKDKTLHGYNFQGSESNIGKLIDEICFVLSSKNLSFFSGTTLQFTSDKSKHMVLLKEFILLQFDGIPSQIICSISKGDLEEIIVSKIKTLRSQTGLDLKWDKFNPWEVQKKSLEILEIEFAQLDILWITEKLKESNAIYNSNKTLLLKIVQQYKNPCKLWICFN